MVVEFKNQNAKIVVLYKIIANTNFFIKKYTFVTT